MKNIRTPRTLADCDFSVGHPLIPRQRRYRLADIVYPVVLFVTMVAIGVLLAWRG